MVQAKIFEIANHSKFSIVSNWSRYKENFLKTNIQTLFLGFVWFGPCKILPRFLKFGHMDFSWGLGDRFNLEVLSDFAKNLLLKKSKLSQENSWTLDL